MNLILSQRSNCAITGPRDYSIEPTVVCNGSDYIAVGKRLHEITHILLSNEQDAEAEQREWAAMARRARLRWMEENPY